MSGSARFSSPFLNASNPRDNLLCRQGMRLHRVPVEAIIYFHAAQKYVTIKHADGELLTNVSLQALETEFGSRFLRVHRSTLVAADAIIGLHGDTEGQQRVMLRECTDQLTVSRRHLPRIRRFLRHNAAAL